MFFFSYHEFNFQHTKYVNYINYHTLFISKYELHMLVAYDISISVFVDRSSSEKFEVLFDSNCCS